MSIEDDEILQGFIEESLEHLADIENDLLAIEETGADIDVELVNKVFRAAHSIKGGAGFMGLTVIQDLAHAAENVLGLIRSGKLIPQPDIINVLLLAADELQHLIEDVGNSNTVDISSHTAALNTIYEGGEAPAAAPKAERAAAPSTAVKVKEETEAIVEPEPELVEEAAEGRRMVLKRNQWRTLEIDTDLHARLHLRPTAAPGCASPQPACRRPTPASG
jgi:two-component system, chemotaxis family, sensor kinase CheA